MASHFRYFAPRELTQETRIQGKKASRVGHKRCMGKYPDPPPPEAGSTPSDQVSYIEKYRRVFL